MPHWLLKTEPSTYSIADLQREKRTRWDGVKNAAALINLRKMAVGDAVLIYHTGTEKAIVGVARVFSADPVDGVITLEFEKVLRHPVALSTIKADGRFKDLALVRISRLSALPVSPAHWTALLHLARG
jgi:predicted RNA-binding protein with PUA-like domain